MNKFSLPVVAAVVRAAAQMVVRRRSRAPGRRARRLQRTVDHVAARPLDDRVDAGGSNKIEGPRVDALMYIQVRQAAVILLDDRRVVGAARASSIGRAAFQRNLFCCIAHATRPRLDAASDAPWPSLLMRKPVAETHNCNREAQALIS